MRRYTLTIGAVLALLIAIGAGISWFGLDQCPMTDRNVCGIYHFQQARLAAAPAQIDLLMLGDSALGNEVDDAVLSRLAHGTVMNLALSGGSLGLGANYVQLQEAVRAHKVRNLVIMFSPAGFRHRFTLAAEGFVFVNRGDPQRYAVSSRVFRQSMLAMIRMLFDHETVTDGARRLFLGVETAGDCLGCDELRYPRQTRSEFRDNGDLRPWKGPVKDFDPFLSRIAAICAAEAINCLYMHGPIVQQALDNNPGYIEQVDAKVTHFGLQVVAPQPIVIPPDEAGDAINHVRSDLRGAYTEKIYRQLAPLLK